MLSEARGLFQIKRLRMTQRFLVLAVILLCARSSALRCATAGDIRQRVGIYIWGRVPDLPGAVLDAKRLGADQVVRTFIGPWSDNPPFGTDLRPLREKALSPDYQSVFRNFRVVMLTAYDSVSYQREYGAIPSEPGRAARLGKDRELFHHHPAHPSAELARELMVLPPTDAQKLLDTIRQEFRDFAFELSKTDRTFIISNWEAENDVPDTHDWPALTRYLQARIDGMIAGRQQAQQMGYPARIFTAFEFTIIPQFRGRESGLANMGSKLRGLDYLSYSSWWSIGSGFNPPEMGNSFRSAIESIRGFAKQAGLPQRIIIGEFGEYWNEHRSAERLRAIVDSSLAGGVEYLFNWVLYEQPGDRDDHDRDTSHFGKFFLNHKFTPQGQAMREWFSVSGVR